MTSPDYDAECRDYLKSLIRQYSIRVSESEFTLSSGEKSKVYCDLKKSVLRHDAAEALARLIHRASEPFGPVDAYAGVALGGCHLASVASTLSDRAAALHVRKEAKDHGTKNLVEAPELPPDSRVVLVEDVTTTAGSALRALEALKAGGHNVVAVVTVVDRRGAWTLEEPAPEVGGVPIVALYRLEEFFDSKPV